MTYHFTRVLSTFNTLNWQILLGSLEMNVFILILNYINMIEDDYVSCEPLPLFYPSF